MRKESGALRNSGNERSLSTRSRGKPWIVDADRGEGRTGRVGVSSESKDRIKLMGSGIPAPFIFGAWSVPPAPGLLKRLITMTEARKTIREVGL
jgi:hypothetical protein